jgi:serine/threonine-protein kinase
MASLYCSQGHENIPDSRYCRECGEMLGLGGVVPLPGGILGKTLADRYRIARELGHGGFGRTYLAEDINRFRESCVLKEFAPQVQGNLALQKAEELFAREAGTLYTLQHSQIPRFRELFRAEVQGKGRLFLVQDYVDGQTYQDILRSRQQQGKCFTQPEMVQFLEQILPVLTYIHDRGVIHRDISPDNLILRSSDQLPVLIDFGGVKQIAAAVTSQINAAVPAASHSITRLGKVGYAPDEQMSRGIVSPHSDLYALAVTVLVLLTGQEPLALLMGGQRSWKRYVSLNPKLEAVLERMLAPDPSQRFQSARDVLQALQRGAPLPKPSTPKPPVAPPPSPHSYPATIAVSPPAPPVLTQSQTVATPVRRSNPFLGILLSLVAIVGLIGVIVWAGSRWILPLLPLPQDNPSRSQNTKSFPSSPPAPEPQFSDAEQERKQAISKQREQLGIDNSFLVGLVNQIFYAKHPVLGGRQLSRDRGDEALRADWDKTAIESLNRLQNLSPEARSRLGQYSDADVQERQVAASKLNLSSPALNDLADAQFLHLFPQPLGKNLLKQPLGQVWQAIATDQLKALQNGSTLQTLQLPAGQSSQQVSNTLQPGQGRAYLVPLKQNQTVQLRLHSDGQPLQISFYPPTRKSPSLLEDSSQTSWSGKLTESGLYEITIVPPGNAPVSFQLDIGVEGEAGE